MFQPQERQGLLFLLLNFQNPDHMFSHFGGMDGRFQVRLNPSYVRMHIRTDGPDVRTYVRTYVRTCQLPNALLHDSRLAEIETNFNTADFILSGSQSEAEAGKDQLQPQSAQLDESQIRTESKSRRKGTG